MLNIALLILAILITGLLIFLILEVRKSKKPQEDSSSMQMLLQQMNDLRSNMDEKITGSQKDMSEAVRNQFSESQN